jgi:hypothetical protein
MPSDTTSMSAPLAGTVIAARSVLATSFAAAIFTNAPGACSPLSNGGKINEKHVEDLDFELRNSTASHAMMVRGSERLPLTAMGKNAEGYLFTLRATWMMPVWPTWTVTSRLEDPRLYAFMSVSRGGDAEANVDWVGDTGHFSDLDGDTLAEERR